jgi:membrane protease YdiL (CAAX protease family)
MNEAAQERREAWIDLALWGPVGSFWIVARLLDWPLAVGIAIVCCAAASFVALVASRKKERARDFGLRTDNLLSASIPIGAFTLALACLEIGWAVATDVNVVAGDLWMLLPVYPLWGIVQQLIVQGVVHRRLATLTRSKPIAIAVTALVFASLHATNPILVALTLAAGVGWSWLFSRWPNVWLLGLSHGVLAALAYPLVLAENPLVAR